MDSPFLFEKISASWTALEVIIYYALVVLIPIMPSPLKGAARPLDDQLCFFSSSPRRLLRRVLRPLRREASPSSASW